MGIVHRHPDSMRGGRKRQVRCTLWEKVPGTAGLQALPHALVRSASLAPLRLPLVFQNAPPKQSQLPRPPCPCRLPDRVGVCSPGQMRAPSHWLSGSAVSETNCISRASYHAKAIHPSAAFPGSIMKLGQATRVMRWVACSTPGAASFHVSDYDEAIWRQPRLPAQRRSDR